MNVHHGGEACLAVQKAHAQVGLALRIAIPFYVFTEPAYCPMKKRGGPEHASAAWPFSTLHETIVPSTGATISVYFEIDLGGFELRLEVGDRLLVKL